MIDPSKMTKKVTYNIDMGTYISLMPLMGSSIVGELSKRVMSAPQKYKDQGDIFKPTNCLIALDF